MAEHQESTPSPTQTSKGSRRDRSLAFRTLEAGDKVALISNGKESGHDITHSNPGLLGKTGVVIEPPSYPSTWCTILVEGTTFKVRPSQIQRLSDGSKPPSPTKLIKPRPLKLDSTSATFNDAEAASSLLTLKTGISSRSQSSSQSRMPKRKKGEEEVFDHEYNPGKTFKRSQAKTRTPKANEASPAHPGKLDLPSPFTPAAFRHIEESSETTPIITTSTSLFTGPSLRVPVPQLDDLATVCFLKENGKMLRPLPTPLERERLAFCGEVIMKLFHGFSGLPCLAPTSEPLSIESTDSMPIIRHSINLHQIQSRLDAGDYVESSEFISDVRSLLTAPLRLDCAEVDRLQLQELTSIFENLLKLMPGTQLRSARFS